ncbi:MAG: HlyD family type I secretion periplasmic adaptor subunit [Pseudomonadota bacterium]
MEETAPSGLRRHLRLAFLTVVILVCGLGGAAALVEINGAVIAPGTIVVETNIKRVQHQEGGIIDQILVAEGQAVGAGDLLVVLDDTLASANLAIITTRLRELQAREARLKVERDGQRTLVLPLQSAQERMDPEIAAILEGQRTLLKARRASREGRKAQLAEQIRQLEEQIAGLAAQRDAKAEEIALIDQELEDLSGLRDKGLVLQSRVTALQRDKARLTGEWGGFISEIARARQAISERNIQVLQIDEEMRAEVVGELQAVRAEVAELTERKVAAEEQLSRIEIRAPRSGFVHQLAVHTVGGVIAPGEDLRLIVPEGDVLVIEVRVAPTDIDQLLPAQDAIIRLPSFDQRTTPELKAQIATVSADLMQDPQTGTAYYQVRLVLTDEEVARLDDRPMIPGMPVEAFVQTGARTILSYLLKPLADHVTYALRDG